MKSSAGPRPLRLHRVATAVIALSLAACGGNDAGAGAGADVGLTPGGPDRSAASPRTGTAVPGSIHQIETRIGDTSVYAVAMPTSTIPAVVAQEHGIERRPDLVQLRISGRRGSAGNLESVPLQAQATVTDLRGQQQTIELKQVVANGLVDYVGMVEADIPDTLRFVIQVKTPDGAAETMQLTREIQPL